MSRTMRDRGVAEEQCTVAPGGGARALQRSPCHTRTAGQLHSQGLAGRFTHSLWQEGCEQDNEGQRGSVPRGQERERVPFNGTPATQEQQDTAAHCTVRESFTYLARREGCEEDNEGQRSSA